LDENRFKQLRTELGITLKSLAKEVGVSDGTLSRYENNKLKPNQDILESIADFYNVTTDYLIGRSDNRYLDNENTITFKINRKLSQREREFLDNIMKILISFLSEKE